MRAVARVLRSTVLVECATEDVICRRLLAALQALLNAKEWRTAAKVGSLGALDAFAEAASCVLLALAGMCCATLCCEMSHV